MRAVLDNGLRFLLGSQSQQGSWLDFAVFGSLSDAWVTAYVGCALLQVSANKEVVSALSRAARCLHRLEGNRSGWGFNGDAEIDADSTAWALRMLCHSNERPGLDVHTALKRFQKPDGGFSTYLEATPWMGSGNEIWQGSQADVSASVLQALCTEPTHNGEAIDECAKYLSKRQREDGSWNGFWFTTPLYATLHALDALNLIGDRWLGRKEALSRSVDFAISLGTDTTDPFVLAHAVEIVARYGPDRSVDHFVERLANGQCPDGKWCAEEPFMLVDPWNFVNGRDSAILDQRGIFTTATVLRALVSAMPALR